MHVSAEEMRIYLKTKRGLSRLRQARKYCKTAKDVLELVKSFSERAADDMVGQRLVGPTSWDMVNRTSPNQLRSPQDCPTNLRSAEEISSSLGSEGSNVNVPSAVQREDELDLYALIKQFEECHVTVNPCSQLLPSRPFAHNYYYPTPSANLKLGPLLPQHHHRPQQQPQQDPFDPDDMEIDMDLYPASSSAFPVSFTPVTTHFVPCTAQQTFVNTSSSTHSSLSQPPLGSPSPISASDTATVSQSRASTTTIGSFSPTPQSIFSTYSACSVYGAVTSSYLQTSQEIESASSHQLAGPYSCIPPTLPHSPSFITPANTLSSSTRVASSLAMQDEMQASYHSSSSSPSPNKSAGSKSGHYPQGFGQSQYSSSNVVNSLPYLTQEDISALPPDQQCANATSISSSSALGNVPTLQYIPSRIPTSPDKLHPTLSRWIENMNKLSSLIDRLQELASAAPAEHRSRLLRQSVALRMMSKKQEERFIEFLQLSEEYANGYLLDISDEIKRQSSFLEKLEARLEAAKKLHGEAINLKRLYESGTVAVMKDLRASALSRPLSEDLALFSEVNSVLTEIRRCYMELDKFWTGEISRTVEALKMRRVDPADLERWKNFHKNLNKTTKSWKTKMPSTPAQTLRRDNKSSSKESDIGTIASSFSTAVDSLTSAIDRLLSSNSIKYSRSGPSSIRQFYLSFAANSDLCLELLQSCADYGERVSACFPPTAPISSRVSAPHNLRERTMKLLSEMTGVSVENVANAQGSRKFKAAYKEAISLEYMTTSELNGLLKKLLSRVTVTDDHGLTDVALPVPDVVSLKQLRKLWEEAEYSLQGALETLKNEPPPQLPTRPRTLSAMKRWLMNLICFS